MSPARPHPNAPRKEAFYVRIVNPEDGTSAFHPATDYIGREMPFGKPRETCAVRVHDDVVAFSLLHVTRKRASSLQGKTIELPNGMLTRLTRRAREVGPIAPGTAIVEHGEKLARFTVTLDEHRVATFEPEGDEDVLELDVRGERLSVYLMSPVRERILALGFIGHLGKPGTTETLTRLVSKVMNAALALPAFQTLSGDIETVVVPSRPGQVAVAPAVTSMTLPIPVRLFADPTAPGTNPTPVAAGQVLLEVDLQHANMTAERLLFTLHPDERLAELFTPYVEVATACVTRTIPQALGDELRGITYDIVLGEVESSTVERLKEMLQKAFGTGIQLTPTRYMLASDSAPVAQG